MIFENENEKERYFLQPFVEGKQCKIFFDTNENGVVSLKAFDDSDKKFKIENSIKKELVNFYKSSKFSGFSTVVFGVLSVNKKNVTNLILNDIFLKDEYDGKTQSRRYDLRYENLIIRFLNLKSKNVKAVFSQKLSDRTIKVFIEQFIKTDSVDKVVFRKNIPFRYENDELTVEDIWTEMTGKIIGFEKAESIRKEFDENQNLTSETPFEYLKAFRVFNDMTNEAFIVEPTLESESSRVEMLNSIEDYIGKECKFKKYDLIGNIGYIFVGLK